MKSKSSMETKKKMEGGDTMAEKTKLTQEQIDALIQKGKENKGVLTYRDVMSFINTLDVVSPEDVENLYEAITLKGLEIVDDTSSDDDMPPRLDEDDNDENSEISEVDLANLTVPEGISIDDPVRMYLKEIGHPDPLSDALPQDALYSAMRRMLLSLLKKSKSSWPKNGT